MERKGIFVIASLAALIIGALLGFFGDDLVEEIAEEEEEGSEHIIHWDKEDYKPTIDPANYVLGVDNPYFPLLPGTITVFEADTEDGKERIEVVVLNETREVMGVECVVVRDTVRVDGVIVEDTYDWYAQDIDGNVWYMGEDVDNFENGVLKDHNGAWEGGIDGAVPGIIMLASPLPSCAYRQEYYIGEAEDMGMIVSQSESQTVQYGSFDDLIMIREWTPLEPDLVAYKFYAEGIGVVLEIEEDERVELQEILSF